MRAAPLAVLIAVVAGILLGGARGPGSAMTMLIAGGALVAVSLHRRGRVGLFVAVAGFALLGTAVMQRALHGIAVSPLTAAVAERANVDVEATLVDDPDGPRFSVHALARVARVDGRDAGGRTVLLSGTGDVTSRLRVLSAGDRVTVTGALEPLTGYDARFRWRHAVARLRVTDLTGFAAPAAALARTANGARGAVLRGSNGLPATERALLAGFLLGDTRAIPEHLVDDFRASGLSHLLAVSGANVAFVLAIVAPLLRRLRLGARLAGGLAVLVLFGTMTRWEPSVLRASAMAGLAMLATFLGRPADGRRLLTLAVTGLLLLDPFLLHSIGFLLSAGASAGIVLLAPATVARLPGPRPIAEALGVTAAAQLGVLPVLVPVFGSVPLVALPANLLAAPAVGPLTVWGLVAGVVGGVLGPGAAPWLQLPTYALLRFVEVVASTAATEPLAVDGRGLTGLLSLACGVVVILRVLKTPGRAKAGAGTKCGSRSDPAGQ
jgi:competence protein ComEC